MTGPASVLAIAAREIGCVEKPVNRTKYGQWFELDGNPWCAMFLCWCFDQAGIAPPGSSPKGFALVQAGVNWAKGHERWMSAPEVGRLACFQFDRDAAADHIGIVESFTTSTVTCIEGNTNTAGERDGGAVMRKVRHRSQVLGYIDPIYTQGEDMTPEEHQLLKDVQGPQNAKIIAILTDLQAKVSKVAAGNVDLDALAAKVADVIAARLKA